MHHFVITPILTWEFDLIPEILFEIDYFKTSSGDLVGLMGLDHISGYTDDLPFYNLNDFTSHISQEIPTDLPARTVVTKNDKAEKDLHVLVFRDSFTTDLIPFFGLHFRQVTYVWQGYDELLVNQINPDVVISAPAERYLDVNL